MNNYKVQGSSGVASTRIGEAGCLRLIVKNIISQLSELSLLVVSEEVTRLPPISRGILGELSGSCYVTFEMLAAQPAPTDGGAQI